MTSRPSYIAPPRWAIQPALTADPAAWRDAIAWPLFNGLSSVGLARTIATVIGFTPTITPRGRAYYSSVDDSASPVILGQMPTTYSHITELTLIVWAIPDKNGGVDGGSASDTLASNTIANSGGLRLFSNQSTSNAARWRLPDSSGGNVDIANPSWQAGHFVQFVGRYGGGQQDFDIYDANTKTADHNSTGSTGVLSFPQINFYIGQRETGNAGSFPGSILYAYIQFHRWTDAQIEANRRDPFAMFRPAPRVVGSSGYSGSHATAWQIATQRSQAIAWHTLTQQIQATTWQIRNQKTQATAWKILTSGGGSQSISWQILNTLSQSSAWDVQTSGSTDSAWRVLNDGSQDTAYRILTRLSRQVAWDILTSGNQATAWSITGLSSASVAIAWEILNSTSVPTAWAVGSIWAHVSPQADEWTALATETTHWTKVN